MYNVPFSELFSELNTNQRRLSGPKRAGSLCRPSRRRGLRASWRTEDCPVRGIALDHQATSGYCMGWVSLKRLQNLIGRPADHQFDMREQTIQGWSKAVGWPCPGCEGLQQRNWRQKRISGWRTNSTYRQVRAHRRTFILLEPAAWWSRSARRKPTPCYLANSLAQGIPKALVTREAG